MAAYSFAPAAFGAAQFDVDAFITAQRSAVSLERLLADLQTFQRHLKNDLVELINNDYADFINLSTNLSGLDKALERIRTPVGSVREDIQRTRDALQETVATLECKLGERAVIREKKMVLQLLLNIHSSVEKVEELLGIREGVRVPIQTDAGGGSSTERVASVFNQLQFYVSQARGLPLLADLQPRIVRITELLKQSLETLFLEGIRQNDADRLTQSLRTYALTDKARDAEELYRITVIAPFVQKTITMEYLDSLSVGGKSKPDALAALYQEVLNFVRMDRASVLAITKSVLRGAGYDLFSNAIWPEVTAAIEKNLAKLFSAGIADDFHKVYTHTMHFVTEFEAQLPSTAAVLTLRSHAEYVRFMQLWRRQLAIYYQIRFKEILSLVDEVFNATGEPAKGDSFRLQTSATVYTAIDKCWHTDVYLQGLAHRFWKLSLQLLARYCTWAETLQRSGNVNASTSGDHSGDAGQRQQAASAQTATVDALSLVGLYEDMNALTEKVTQLFNTRILGLMPPSFANSTVLRESFDAAVNRCQSLVPMIEGTLVQLLVAQGSEALVIVRSIPSMYRMTNREPPTKALDYVNESVLPLRKFLDTQGQHKAHGRWAAATVDELTTRYVTLVSEVLQTVKKTEDTLMRLKKTKRKNALNMTANQGADAGDGDMTDEDKIRHQLTLDVAYFGDQIQILVPNAKTRSTYLNLVDLLSTKPTASTAPTAQSTSTAVEPTTA